MSDNINARAIPPRVQSMSDAAIAGAILYLVATGKEPDRLADLQAEGKRRNMRRKGENL